jgi:hypothetical protein
VCGHGLFSKNPWSVGISGGFSSLVADDLIAESDFIIGFGASSLFSRSLSDDADRSIRGQYRGLIGRKRNLVNAGIPDLSLKTVLRAASAAKSQRFLRVERLIQIVKINLQILWRAVNVNPDALGYSRTVMPRRPDSAHIDLPEVFRRVQQEMLAQLSVGRLFEHASSAGGFLRGRLEAWR